MIAPTGRRRGLVRLFDASPPFDVRERGNHGVWVVSQGHPNHRTPSSRASCPTRPSASPPSILRTAKTSQTNPSRSSPRTVRRSHDSIASPRTAPPLTSLAVWNCWNLTDESINNATCFCFSGLEKLRGTFEEQLFCEYSRNSAGNVPTTYLLPEVPGTDCS